jgi:Flp pilus assembly protein TadD
MQAGNYSDAIRLLRRAVDTAPRDSLTYAYALYNLGRSLVLSGNPREALPILRARLLIPNQTATVRAELARAERASGLAGQSSASGPPGSSPGAPAPPGHDHGRQHDGQGGGAD